MPPGRLAGLRPGDMLESPTFPLPGGCRGRFQLFPKGDSDSLAKGVCSLWLCATALSKIEAIDRGADATLEAFKLRRQRGVRAPPGAKNLGVLQAFEVF